MRKYAVVLLSGVLGLSACSEKKATWSQSEVNAKIDSMVGERLSGLSERSMEDLNNRMSIEVKVKVDSILAEEAKLHPAAPAIPAAVPDTTTIQP